MIHRFGEFEFDDTGFELRRRGVRIALEPRVLDLLGYLVARPQQMVGKDDLLAALWGGLAVSESSLTRCMSALRSALGDSRRAGRIIETVHGRGYRFTAAVRVEPGLAGDEREDPATFVGREDVIDRISSALDDAMESRGRLVLLSGEAGIGKTRTTDRLGRIAAERGASVRFGRCREEPGAPPLWPWLQVLRQELADLGPSEMRARLGRCGDELAELLPELGNAGDGLAKPTPEDPERSRFRLFDSVSRYLRRAARDRCRVIVIDDLHRADPSSLALLRFVASELEAAGILLLATFRDAELTVDPERREQAASLLRDAAAELVELDGFSSAEVARLAAASCNLQLSPEEGERLRAYTGGNPFFLHHVLRALRSRGARPLATELPKLPRGVRTALAWEIERLDPAVHRLLRCASVLGRQFEARLVAEVGGLDAASVLRGLQPAIGLRLVEAVPERQGDYRFVHELVRESLYEELDSFERARLHREAGEAFEKQYPAQVGPHLAELAHHFLQAAALTDPARSFRYVRAAGDWAHERFAYEEAVSHYRSALGLLDRVEEDVELRCDLLIVLAEAEARSGRRASAAADGERAAQLARALGSAQRLARAALAVSPGFFALEIGVFDRRLSSLLELALEALAPRGRDEWVVRARLLGRLALCLYWSGRDAQIAEVNERAAEAATRADCDDALGYARVAHYVAHGGPGGAVTRLALARDIVRHAERSPDVEQALMGEVFAMTALLELGRVAELDREIARFELSARRSRQPQSFWYARMYRAMRALMRGRFGEADALAREYLVLGQRIDDNNVRHCHAAHTLLSALERSLGENVIVSAEEHMNLHPEYPTWRGGLAWGCAECGRRDLAEPLLDETAGRLLDVLPRDINWLSTVGLLAQVAWLLGATRHAEALRARLAPHADGFVTSGFGMVYFGSVEAYLGRLAALLGERDAALGHFERALAKERRVGAAPWAVRAQESQAEALRRFGREREARSAARTALDGARKLGMVRVADRLERAFALGA